MKFPDLIHALRPEPNNQIPQAASAHDTFWDFVSLMPEPTHMLLWIMSDQANPPSLRMMQGFDVHTFRPVNDAGASMFCKFHWNPVAGAHSVTWDEAVKINGANADFHRRDLWNAIESGAFPEWELGIQVFTVAEVHTNQRNGIRRQSILQGRVTYEPNWLGGGCPFRAGISGFVSFPAPVFEDKVRGKSEKYADHFSQARLFWNSQTPVEKKHIIAAFRFELPKVQVPAIRERTVSMRANVAHDLAQGVADGLGFAVPKPQPRTLDKPAKPEVVASPALSLFARLGDGGVKTRQVAMLVCDGVDGASLQEVHSALIAEGAVPKFLAASLGTVAAQGGTPIKVDVTFEATASALWDAVVLPAGSDAQPTLQADKRVLEFVKEQYRHCKLIVALG
jgi:hypothetical protein